MLQRCVITGAAGMLGSALLELAPASAEAHGVDLPEGDLSDPAVCREVLAAREPEVVLHCAGYTDVDGCTRDPARAQRHNAVATGNVARVCRELGARLVYVSTDYVFSGEQEAPYTEEDTPGPLSPYGESKLAGERRAREELPDLAIVRTQWLYGPGGRNFVASVLDRARRGEGLRVVADQWGSPTYTRDLARGLWRVALQAPPGGCCRLRGIVHLTNSGAATWVELARAALCAAGLAEAELTPIPAAEWPSPTRRPRFSVLDNARWREVGWEPLRPWPEAVEEYVRGYLR